MIFMKKASLRLIFLVLTLILAGWGCGSSDAPAKTEKESKVSLPPQAMEHLYQGQKFLTEKKFDEALKEFQETARLAPESPLAHYWLGRCYFYRQDKEQAEKAFKEALQKDPKNYQSLVSLARLYSLDLSKLDQAEKLLQQALDESPDNLEGRFVLGVVYGLKGEKQKALKELNFTFAKEGELALYHFEIGRILENTAKDKKQALEHYQRALVLNPGLAVAQEAAKRLGGELAQEAQAKAQLARPVKPKSLGKKPPKQ